jgi:uncharacterized repeat protein (TIGR01451 family)
MVKRATTLALIGLLMIGVSGVQASALSPAQQTQTVTFSSDQEVAVGYNANLDEKVAYDSTEDRLRFGNYMAPSPNPGDAFFRTYLRFDLGGLPADAVIQQATLSMYVNDQRFPSGTLDTGAYRVNSPWTEAGLRNTASWTWGSLPAFAPTPASVVNVSGLDLWYTWDVTVLAQAWHDGSAPNLGVVLSESPQGTAIQGFGAYSRSGSMPQLAPRLVVTYVGSAAAPPTPGPAEIKPAIVKWADSQEVLPGQDVTFTIQATNHGRDAPIDVVITDVLSEHLEILEATTTQGTVKISGQTVTANVGVIGQNFVVEVVIRGRVREDAPAPLEIENTALFRSPNGGEHRTAPAIVTVADNGPIKLPVTGSTATRWGMLVILAVVLIVVVIELRPGRHTFGGD